MSSFPQSALVVGLGGVTNGGKTTMCKALEHFFSSIKSHLRVKSMHADDYFRPTDDPHHIHLEKFDHHDWDCLDAMDTERFLQDLQAFRSQCDLLLVEGFLIFNMPSPSDKPPHLFHLAYYFDLPYEECCRRRHSRHYDPPDPPGYFEEHVWGAYLKAKKEAFQQNKGVELELVDTTKESFEKIEEKIINDIEQSLRDAGKSK